MSRSESKLVYRTSSNAKLTKQDRARLYRAFFPQEICPACGNRRDKGDYCGMPCPTD